MNLGSGRIILLGNLSSNMNDAVKTADAHMRANLKNLAIEHDLNAHDLTIQALNLSPARESSETSPGLPRVHGLAIPSWNGPWVVLGEMSVQGLLLKVAALPERMRFAV